jgi:hypothetical protein
VREESGKPYADPTQTAQHAKPRHRDGDALIAVGRLGTMSRRAPRGDISHEGH